MSTTQELTAPSRWMRHARREPRDSVSGWGTLTWDDGVRSQRAVVEVRNLSDNGVQVNMSEALRSGTRAYLTGTEFRCVGTVRHCEGEEGQFRIGIEFDYRPNFKDAIA